MRKHDSFEDDGRTIADMSGIGPTPTLLPHSRKPAAAPEPVNDRPWEQPDEWALYDLQADPMERDNLYGDPAHAGTVTRLKARITELRARIGDVDPPGYVAPTLEPGKCPA